MRFLIVVVVATLFCASSFAQESQSSDSGFASKDQYATKFELFAGEKLISESEVTFVRGFPASMIVSKSKMRIVEDGPVENIAGNMNQLILAGTSDTVFDKPDSLSDETWGGFWLAAQHLIIGELDFYVYSPGADRILIQVDLIPGVQKETGTVVDIQGLADLEKVSRNRLLSEFYGSLEMPYHCNAIGKPLYMLEIEGTSDGRVVREHQLAMLAQNGISCMVLCKPAGENVSRDRVPSCLMLVVPENATNAELDGYLFQALDGFEEPPFETVKLGPFAFHYYFPKSDDLEFSLWELDGEYSEDWQTSAKFLGRTRLANNQPMPPVL